MKKLLPVFIGALIMICALWAVPAYASGEGSGTEEDPFLIATKADLNDVRNNPAACYKLTADIIFTEDDFKPGGDFYNDGAGFLPIGDSTVKYSGTFDGDNHKIVGLQQNNMLTLGPTGLTNGGLFGESKGKIKSLGMVDCQIKGVASAAGGIVGTMTEGGSVTNCYNTGSVSGHDIVGGIVGEIVVGTIKDCYNTGDISNGGKYIGGIAGEVNSTFAVENCYNSGNITAASNPDELAPQAGGITGRAYAGDKDSGTIQNCYNLGNVDADTNGTAGGISGYIYYTTISSCYNIGEVYGASDTIGGVTGTVGDHRGTFNNCYYRDNAAKGIAICTTDTSRKLTSIQMQDSNNFTGFDFDTKWTMEGNETYLFPELRANDLAGKYVCAVSISGGSSVIRTRTITLSANITPADADIKTVKWSVINGTGQATITSDGVLTGVQSGTVTVRATGQFGIYGEKTISITPIYVGSITVTGKNGADSLYRGASLQMNASVLPNDADNKSVTWSVENETGKATISATGLLTGVSEGTVLAKATAQDGSGITGTKEITVLPIPLYAVTVVNGTGSGSYPAGTDITITANPPQNYLEFDRWIIVSGTAAINNRDSASTILTVETNAVTVKAVYRLTDEALQLLVSWLDAKATGNNEITVSWEQVQMASAVEIWRSTSSSGKYTVIASEPSSSSAKTSGGTVSAQSSGGIMAYCDKDLKTGITYYYKTRAVLDSTSGTVYGSFSNVKSAKAVSNAAAPQTPSGLSAAPKEYNSVGISWKKTEGAKGYIIYKASELNGKYSEAQTLSANSWTDTKCTMGTTYYYRVRSYTLSGGTKVCSDFSPEVSAAPALSTPVITAKAATTSIKITWRRIAGASGYEVWRSTSQDSGYTYINSAKSAGYTDKNPIPNMMYYYKIKVYRIINGERHYNNDSNIANAKPVLAATTVKAAATSATSIKITWRAVSGRNGYEVLRSTSPDSGYSLIKSTTGTYYTNTGLDTGTTYYYKVRAYVLINGSRYYSDDSDAVSATPILSKVTAPKAVKSAPGKIKISWRSVESRSGYEVWRSSAIDGEYAQVYDTGSTYYNDLDASIGTPYYYKVRAYRMVNGIKVYGDFSIIVSAKA